MSRRAAPRHVQHTKHRTFQLRTVTAADDSLRLVESFRIIWVLYFIYIYIYIYKQYKNGDCKQGALGFILLHSPFWHFCIEMPDDGLTKGRNM
jgi:hypothetical protein